MIVPTPTDRLLDDAAKMIGHVYDPHPAIQALFVEAQRYQNEAGVAERMAEHHRKGVDESTERAASLLDLRDKVLATIERLEA